ncbi:hypothetical protein CPB83DRAFT_855045 [Crepidotus variabilis]|uniref:Uncharacterized protein n=1 Tax=Crepidotus variabilis TaxID=179855 RepID=A0A9P6EFL6_9AGAR|nr:hypothetical protein CPB83DRAFT_855045 [Crepidotus variabilis]
MDHRAVENLFCKETHENSRYLRGFLIRSRCSLASLNISFLQVTDDELFSALCLPPHIDHLTIRGNVARWPFEHFGQTAHSTETEKRCFCHAYVLSLLLQETSSKCSAGVSSGK